MAHRIKEIKISGLFDMFDHTIPLNMDERLTIIYGENGMGKTMIFRILDALFSRVQNLVKLPFREYLVTFGNDDFVFGH